MRIGDIDTEKWRRALMGARTPKAGAASEHLLTAPQALAENAQAFDPTRQALGALALPYLTDGMYNLWQEGYNIQPISAVPLPIRSSLYQRRSYVMANLRGNRRWYPRHPKANTLLGASRPTIVPVRAPLVPGNTPAGAQQGPMQRFYAALETPRYSNAPATIAVAGTPG